MSRPVWGAWIEIAMGSLLAQLKPSRPVWGAWIEIESYNAAEVLAKGRAPYGARGLKCLQGRRRTADLRVAPRMGRVD